VEEPAARAWHRIILPALLAGPVTDHMGALFPYAENLFHERIETATSVPARAVEQIPEKSRP